MKKLYYAELPSGDYLSIEQWGSNNAVYMKVYNSVSTIGWSAIISYDKIPHIIQALSKVEKLLPLL